MADSGERRMLFDTRGRRKNVIRVVYATLALLMGGSLFLTVGPFNIAELFGNGGSSNAGEVFDDQVERVEGQLAKNPKDEALLLSLTRAQISAGNAKVEVDPRTGRPTSYPPEAQADLEAARETWNRYLRQAGGDPNPAAAQLVASTFFGLAEMSTSFLEAIANIKTATDAQQIVVEQRPNTGSLTTLAIYQYFNGEFDEGDETVKEAAADVPKAEATNIEKQMAEYRKNAESFDRRKKQLEKVQERVGKQQGGQTENPFGFNPSTPPPSGE